MGHPQHERWYDIPGYEKQYQVSTRGRVRALARVDAGGHHRSMKVLRPNARPSGRRFFTIYRRGVPASVCVSVLIAGAYRIRNSHRCGYIIHRNRDNADFRRSNLAWATLAEQRMHDGHKVNCPYYGVTCHGNRGGVFRWTAALRVNYRRRDLGFFATPEEAAYTYDCEVRRLGINRPLNGLRRPRAWKPELRSLPGEVWRPFPGAERTHRISNKGRVRTVAYLTARGQRVTPKLRRITVDANGCRTILVRGRRYGLTTALARSFRAKAG